MKAIGIHCSIAKSAINCAAVYIESDDGVLFSRAEQFLRFKGVSTGDLAKRLQDLHDALVSALSQLEADVVVVRAADFNMRRQITEATVIRANAEGVALLAARTICGRVETRRGVDVGVAYGGSKVRAEARAAEVLPNADEQACAAAIGGLRELIREGTV